jgi:hypothetical protein
VRVLFLNKEEEEFCDFQFEGRTENKSKRE